jgi:hypothetical protein
MKNPKSTCRFVGRCVGLVLVMCGPATAQFRPVEHPFILWNKEDAAAIRRMIEKESWAKTQYAAMVQKTGPGKTLRNLFR